MITLYEFAPSGNCHKIRMLLSFLGLDYQSVKVNGSDREQKSPEFLSKNPFGQVPVLQDGDIFIRDSQAILVYLAKQYGDETWLSNDAVTLAEITAWLSTAANEVARGPATLRAHYKFGRAINIEEVQQITANVLSVLETHLSTNTWLVGDHISIADLAIYPYIALAGEGQIDLANYVSIKQWLQRIQALPAYVGMPGM
jgi:glutathione S-transferase